MTISDQNIKKPNVSGQFYSADPEQLSREVEKYITAAEVAATEQPVKMIIVPHAGYIYSGSVAGYGFKAVKNEKVKTIIILAPSHFYGFDGVSVWTPGGFETPLGRVLVDQDFTDQLIAANDKFYFKPEAFEKEHSLEVEIPFLQETFENFEIVAVIMGQTSYSTLEAFAHALNKIIDDRDDVLVVVSTDLSHYHNDATARKMDQRAMDAIEAIDPAKVYQECSKRSMEMCGFIPVTAGLLYAKIRGLHEAKVLNYANSGDVSGDRDRVVGYTSVTFSKGDGPAELPPDGIKESDGIEALSMDQKRRLINIAKQTIHDFVLNGEITQVSNTDPRLMKDEGAFVTINKNGRLRGCIGNIIGSGPLYTLVRDMAISAASKDPRFTPLKKEELDQIEVEVSVLSKPRVITNIDEFIIGKHGVIVSQGPGHSGVFLPQVAESTGWSREEFLSNLCSQKARLPADAWKDPRTKIEIFSAQVFSEHDVQ